MTIHISIGIIFNGRHEGHQTLLHSLQVASRPIFEKGWGLNILGKAIGDIGNLKNSKEIKFIGDKLNVGFGCAHNSLMQHAFSNESAKIYLCLNDDTIVAPDAIINAVDFIIAKNTPCLVESMQVPCEHPKIYDPLTLETPWCSGAALYISKEIYAAIKGFDENIFMYCEDVDFSWRSRLIGAKCYMLPNSRVFHEVNPQGRKPLVISRHMLEAGRYLGYKWGAIEFQRLMEKRLVDGGFYPSDIYLPPLPVGTQRFASPPEFCEFRQELSFSIPRWR